MEVHGVIRDREGAGIEGLGVQIGQTESYGHSIIAGAWTNRNGAFRLRVRPGRYTVILSGRDLRVPTVFLDSTNITSPMTRLDYRYGGFKVEGRLIGPGGKPVRAGTIEVMGDSPDFRRGLNLGAKLRGGRYVLFLPRGTYYFKTKPLPEYLPATEGPPKINIAADTTIDFSAEGNLVEGNVRIAGLPWSRGEIHAGGRTWPGDVRISSNSRTSTDGRYRFYLPDGQYSFSLNVNSAAAYIVRPWLNREVNGSGNLDLNFARIRWSGTIRDSVTGRPLEGANVEAIDTQRQLPATSMSNKTGRFLLMLESGREYRLTVSGGQKSIAPSRRWIRARRDSSFDLLVRPGKP